MYHLKLRTAPILTLAALALASFAATAATPSSAHACTAFGTPGIAPIVAKNYDWANGDGVVHTNHRGVRRTGMTRNSQGETPAQWTARYSSVTFNQYGKGMPNGGMNERGLVVEVLWLTGSRYPPRDKRPALNELQWVQYQLDNFATLAEVQVGAPFVRVANLYAPVHYFVCDASGQCGTFEFLDGNLVMHTGDKLPFPALANDTYADSTTYASGAMRGSLPAGPSSLARFTRAAAYLKKSSTASVQGAFKALDDVAQGDYTKWQIVYEPKHLKAHFRTHKHRAIKSVTVPTGPGAHCRQVSQAFDMAATEGGAIGAKLSAYSDADNRSMVKSSFMKLGLAALPLLPLVKRVADIPGTTKCVATPTR